MQADNYKSPSPPTLTDLLDEQKRDVQMSINCHQIGTIQSFDPATQLATVKIALKQVVSVAPDGTRLLQEYPLLLMCPVFVLFGGVDFLSMPIEAGDNCIVLFNDRSIDAWLSAGDGQAPSSSRVHDLSDGIALVGIRPLTNSIAGYINNGIRLSHGGGNSKIDLLTDLIDITAQLTDFHGNVRVRGNLTIDGDTFGNGSDQINLKADLIQDPAYVLEAGNGATGTFTIVNVVKGIVVSGT